MKKRISLKSLILSLMFALFSAIAVGAAVAVPVLPLFGGLVISSFIQMPGGFAMSVQKEIWMNDIVGNVFKSNPHLAFAMNADEFVLAGKVVHIQNAGAKPATKRNRKNFPATVTQRQDSDITYVLDEFTSDPIKISNAEQYEESPQKRASVMGDQSNALAEIVGDWFFYYWRAEGAAQIKRTTGENVVAHVGTGNRKAVTAKDVKAMAKIMTNAGIPKKGRVCQMDAEMMDQFTSDLTVNQDRDFSKYYDAENNIIGRLFGFTFIEERATVLNYTNDATPVALDPETDPVNTSNASALFWQPDQVIRSLGEKEFFESLGEPTQYGDVYSALLRAGGRKKRADNAGVYALVQAAGA